MPVGPEAESSRGWRAACCGMSRTEQLLTRHGQTCSAGLNGWIEAGLRRAGRHQGREFRRLRAEAGVTRCGGESRDALRCEGGDVHSDG